MRFRSQDGVHILYTDAEARHVIQGNVLELRSGRDLTDERLRKLSAIDFRSLPLDQAVKIQRGSGKRVLAIFSDAYCPACKQFEGALQQVDDITIYVFMYPVIRPDLSEHSKAVWCSADRGAAWLDLVLRGKRRVSGPGGEKSPARAHATSQRHADADLRQRRAPQRRPAEYRSSSSGSITAASAGDGFHDVGGASGASCASAP